MRYLFGALAALALCSTLSFPANAATIDGETVQIDYRFPDLGTTTDTSGQVVVAPGTEAYLGSSFFIDVSGNSMELTLDPFLGASTFFSTAFNGVVLTDILGSFGDFTSASLTTFFIESGAPSLSFDSDNIYLNFSGVEMANQAGSQLVARVDFTIGDTAVVPLPAGALLLFSGLGLLSITRRSTRVRGVER